MMAGNLNLFIWTLFIKVELLCKANDNEDPARLLLNACLMLERKE